MLFISENVYSMPEMKYNNSIFLKVYSQYTYVYILCIQKLTTYIVI